MISSIFGKTKPINFIILIGFLVVFYGLVQIFVLEQAFLAWNIGRTSLAVVSLMAALLLLDFVVKRNKLTGNNSFAILYFTLLIVLFPSLLADHNSLLCNLFLLLALRRILAFRSLKSLRLKIFDATFLILVASLFQVWALLFLLLVLLSIYIFEPKTIVNWLSLFPAVISFSLVLYASLILLDQTQFLSDHYNFFFDFGQWRLAVFSSSIKLMLYVFLSIALGIFSIVRLGKKGMGKLISFRILLFAFFLGLLMTIFDFGNATGTIVVTFAPAAIFLANYIESVKRERILELLLMISISIPCLVFALQLLLT